MPQERRQHSRYEPLQRVDVRLSDRDGAAMQQAQLDHLAEAGCCLMTLTPPRGGMALAIEFSPDLEEPGMVLDCRMTGRLSIGQAWHVSLAFENISAENQARIRKALASADAFRAIGMEAPPAYRKHWRVDQWAAYLTTQDMPVMSRSKLALTRIEAQEKRPVSAKDLAELAQNDPFLCLCLLREAESRRTDRLGHETTTTLAAVMQIGERGFKELLLSSPETDETIEGLAICEARAAMAGRLAKGWSEARADSSPDELVMGSLFAEIGELLLWHFAPELPQAALDALASGDAQRSAEAQELCCGFKFKDLTLKCSELWHLPAILVQLIRGTDSTRANIARVCINTARHLAADANNPALPDDLADAKLLIPGVSMEWLASWLHEVAEENRSELVAKAEAALERKRLG